MGGSEDQGPDRRRPHKRTVHAADFFEFIPRFKLFVAGNHKPSLRTVDEAIKRRLNLVPFSVTIPVEDRNLKLAEELKEEWPGILQWAIEGCLDWQRIGLKPPPAVLVATKNYFETEDAFSSWFEECCVEEPGVFTTRKALFESWAAWAIKAGEEPGSQKHLVQVFENRGYSHHKSFGSRGFLGLRLKAAEHPHDPPYGD